MMFMVFFLSEATYNGGRMVQAFVSFKVDGIRFIIT